MSGLSKYPIALDDSSSLPFSIDKQTQVVSDVVNRLRDAILSIESELDYNVSGTFSTAKARFESLEAQVATLGLLINSIDPGGSIDLTAILNAITNLQNSVAIIQSDITIIEGDITSIEGDITSIQSSINTLNSQVSQAQTDIQILYSLYNNLLALLNDGYFGSATTSGLAKRRVTTSSNQIASVNTNTTIQFNTTSSLYTPTNSTLTSFALSGNISGGGTFNILGAVSVAPLTDAPISGISLSVLLNGTPIQTFYDYGAIWSRDIPRTFPFALTARLIPSDAVSVRWSHSGSASSQSVVLSGDTRTWFEIVSI